MPNFNRIDQNMQKTQMKTPSMPVSMSIAGSDSGGGAGIQADLLTFSAFGVYGTTAITCLTAQSPEKVSRVVEMDQEFVRQQMEEVAQYFRPKSVKTGMLFNKPIIATVADFLSRNPELPAVVDPVMVTASGSTLLERSAVEVLKDRLLPLASLITPNLDEAKVLLGYRPQDLSEMREAAHCLSKEFGTAVFLKGGHLDGAIVYDVLCQNEDEINILEASKKTGVNTHGSGCTVSAAIAAGLAHGQDLLSSVEAAHSYLQSGIEEPLHLRNEQFISH